MSETARLTRGSIRGHLVGQTAPMIIGVAALLSIGLVDAYFIGQLGSTQLAAISFIFPITVALSSMGVGVMVGINSVVARALGEGDLNRAVSFANLGIVFAVGLGVAMGGLVYVGLDPLFGLMNADAETLPFIREYMRPFALGLPLLLALMGVNGTLRGQGEARKTSYVSLCYAAVNWVLDPVLITGAFGFEGFGVAGAAYATLVGWGLAALFGLWLLRQTRIDFAPRACLSSAREGGLKPLVRVAAPAAFSNSINPIGLSVLTALIAVEGQAAVAGFGAAGRLQSFAVVPLLGLSGSIGAIVGQNWGAGEADRARSAMRQAFAFCLGYGLVTALVLFAFAEPLARVFTDDPQVVEQFRLYLVIAAWGYGGFGLLIVANGILNAVDRAGTALLQSGARVFLVMLPFAWLLRPAWDERAVYGAELVANILGGVLAAFIAWRVLSGSPARQLRQQSPA